MSPHRISTNVNYAYESIVVRITKQYSSTASDRPRTSPSTTHRRTATHSNRRTHGIFTTRTHTSSAGVAAAHCDSSFCSSDALAGAPSSARASPPASEPAAVVLCDRPAVNGTVTVRRSAAAALYGAHVLYNLELCYLP